MGRLNPVRARLSRTDANPLDAIEKTRAILEVIRVGQRVERRELAVR